jgi:hypothetical protein
VYFRIPSLPLMPVASESGANGILRSFKTLDCALEYLVSAIDTGQ